MQKIYRCDYCNKAFDEDQHVHALEYEGCIDLCCKCYDTKFSECSGCIEDFYKHELHRYEDNNETYWYCDQCLNETLHDNKGFN